MARRNLDTDIFNYIDMHGGDRSVCWEWKTTSKGGGRDNRPYFNFDGKKFLAYKFVYELMFGKVDKGIVLRHKCDNQRCCNPFHLEQGTQAENMQDVKDRERAGLPKSVVKAIKQLGSEGKTPKEIAKLYGLKIANVRTILRGDSYKEIE